MADLEPIVGGYLRVDIDGIDHRVYVERAGTGVPLLCLHTAGSDSRQFRGVLNDPEVIDRFEVVAFDLPWHGKSSPPVGWEQGEYRLTAARYVRTVLSVSQALGLDRPIVLGCSIGGRVVLHLASDHPDEVGGVIGLQSGAHVDPYYDLSWLHRSDVHGGEVCAGIVSGLIGPDAPDEGRWETLWHYMQGGPGVFRGDLHFYTSDGDVSARLGQIDTARCPVFLLSGDYDYSAPPDDARAVAAAVPGSELTVMAGLGHFPMSEDYERFRPHLLDTLGRAASRRSDRP